MDEAFHSAYTLSNVIFGILTGGFCILLAVLQVPRHEKLRNYRRCRIFLALTFLATSLVSLSELLFPGQNQPQALRMNQALTLIIASIETFFLPAAFITLVNIKFLDQRKMVWELIPLSVLSALTLVCTWGPVPPLAFTLVYGAFFLYYLSQLYRASLLIFTQTRWIRRQMDNYFSGDETAYLSWFKPMSFMALATGFLAIVLFLVPSWFLSMVLTVSCTVVYLFLTINYLNYPFVFKLIGPTTLDQTPENPGADKHYKASKLTHLDVEHLLLKLDQTMGTQELYTNPKLTIAHLAGQLHLTIHQTSELINGKRGTSFRAYINTFRVEKAKQLLESDGDQNILDIAFACGFNSKSAFNSAFQASTGQTPRQWRAQATGTSGK